MAWLGKNHGMLPFAGGEVPVSFMAEFWGWAQLIVRQQLCVLQRCLLQVGCRNFSTEQVCCDVATKHQRVCLKVILGMGSRTRTQKL